MNLSWGSLPPICFEQASAINRREGRSRPPNDVAYESYGVPWLKDDINARLKTMPAAEIERVDGQPFVGTFVRFNASPWFTTRIIDLIGVKDRKIPRRDRHPSQSRAGGHRALRDSGDGGRRRRDRPAHVHS